MAEHNIAFASPRPSKNPVFMITGKVHLPYVGRKIFVSQCSGGVVGGKKGKSFVLRNITGCHSLFFLFFVFFWVAWFLLGRHKASASLSLGSLSPGRLRICVIKAKQGGNQETSHAAPSTSLDGLVDAFVWHHGVSLGQRTWRVSFFF